LAVAGATHPDIAEAIGISVPTLRKVFADELKDRLGEVNLFAAAASDVPPPAPPKQRLSPRSKAGGRKAYRPTSSEREKVAVLLAAGMSLGEIAKVLDKSEPTVRKHFAAEISTGALRKRADVLTALSRTALGGNVAALKEMLAIMERADLGDIERRIKGRVADEPKAETIGKKVQAKRDAHSVVMKGPWADLVRSPRT
jgi:DNA-binding transcriptional MerR regulator